MHKIKPVVLGVLAVSLLMGAIAFVGWGKRSEVVERGRFAKARINQYQAVVTAERYLHGQAVWVERQMANGKPVYGVKVFKAGRITDVQVDPRNGRVLGNPANRRRHEEYSKEEGGEDDLQEEFRSAKHESWVDGRPGKRRVI